MFDEFEIKVFELPEITKEEIIYKIKTMAQRIRNDWNDPRAECRAIISLCDKLSWEMQIEKF